MVDAPRDRLETAESFLNNLRTTWQTHADASFGDRYTQLADAHIDALVTDEELLWNVYARTYGALEHLAAYRELQDEVVSLLDMSGVRKMVDLGCGPALLERRLAREGQLAGVHVSCFELSDAMRDEAAHRTYDWRQVGVDISFTPHNLNDALPLEPASTDRIVCTNVLGFLTPDRARSVMREIRLALRPGGRFVMTTQKPDFDLGHILRVQTGAPSTAAWSLRAHPEHLAWMLETAMQYTDPDAHEACAFNMLANSALLRLNSGSAPYTPDSAELTQILEDADLHVTHCGDGYADQYHVIAAEAGHRAHICETLLT